jgi:hypothetical protein
MSNKIKNDDDFGFISMTETAVFKVKNAKETVVKEKMLEIYNMIMPLLMNLKKDADKNEYIYWPNRAAKIDEFIAKLDKIIKS